MSRSILDREMLRQPSRLGRRRARGLERLEKSVGEERVVVAGTSVPFARRDLGEAGDDLHRDVVAAIGHRAQRTSKIASTSTATLAGSTLTPTAARAWRPASPKTSTMRFDAPFTTCGCCVKSSTELTKPPSRTQRM